jgi:ATP-dependent RNA/DNA helicase IGHMBP2
MHPSICKYVSDSFYDGKLCTPKEVSAARLSADAHGLYWVTYPRSDANVDAEKAPRKGSTSKQNSTEAGLVAAIACCPSLKAKYVMVITFYKAQENLIRETLSAAGLVEDSDPKNGLRICSVDQAQGSEADVVILSCVRSNSARELGFVTNTNRLNVAVSRARERLVVVGDVSTLGADKHWASLIRLCRRVAVESLPLIGQASSELKVAQGVSSPAMPLHAPRAASRTVTVTVTVTCLVPLGRMLFVIINS